MADLDRVLKQKGYSPLPLPSQKRGPTTIFSFHNGQMIIVRNAHTCLPDPPNSVMEDPSADAIEVVRKSEFTFSLKGILGFLSKMLGTANVSLDASKVTSATLNLGGLSQHTIQTGTLVDYLVSLPLSSCSRDIFDKSNLTIVAALQANSFTYTFKNSSGATVAFSLPEAKDLFQADVSAKVSVTAEGKVVVESPRFIGVVAWDGQKLRDTVTKARNYSRGRSLVPFKAPDLFRNATTPDEVSMIQAASLGVSQRMRTVSSVKSTRAGLRKRKAVHT